jgi:hypothetical protein
VTAPTEPTPGAPATEPTPQPAPTPGAPEQPTEDITSLPEWAQKQIRDARAEAAKSRTTAKQTAAQEARDQVTAQKAKVQEALDSKPDKFRTATAGQAPASPRPDPSQGARGPAVTRPTSLGDAVAQHYAAKR